MRTICHTKSHGDDRSVELTKRRHTLSAKEWGEVAESGATSDLEEV